MERKFEFPEVSVYEFATSDIITTSNGFDGEGVNSGGLPPQE